MSGLRARLLSGLTAAVLPTSTCDTTDSAPQPRVEQPRDWTRVGLASFLELSGREAGDISHDSVPVRDAGLADLVRQSTDVGHSLLRGDILHVLDPQRDPHFEVTPRIKALMFRARAAGRKIVIQSDADSLVDGLAISSMLLPAPLAGSKCYPDELVLGVYPDRGRSQLSLVLIPGDERPASAIREAVQRPAAAINADPGAMETMMPLPTPSHCMLSDGDDARICLQHQGIYEATTARSETRRGHRNRHSTGSGTCWRRIRQRAGSP